MYVAQNFGFASFTPPARDYRSCVASLTYGTVGITMDGAGDVLVADTVGHQVVKYHREQSGLFTRVDSFGFYGYGGLGQMPWATDVDVVGDYAFVVAGENKIQRFHYVGPGEDLVAPVTSSQIASGYVNTATVSINATDGAGSGVGEIRWELDGASERATTTVPCALSIGLGYHQLKYWAVDAAGNIETKHVATFTVRPPPPPPQWYDTGFSITAPTSVLRNTGPKVTVTLRGYHPGTGIGMIVLPLPGKSVRFDRYVPGTGWVYVGSATTGSDGRASRTMPAITKSTSYRARFVAAYPYRATTSRTVTVGVKDYLTAPSVPAAIGSGDTFTVRGFISPRHASGLRTINLRFYHYENNGWNLRGTVAATTSYYSSTWTRYSAGVRVWGRGRWMVAADHSSTSHAYSISAPSYFTCY